MRGRCLRCGLSAPRLDHNNRFGERNFARRRQEAPRIANRFHVDHDALGKRVITQVIDQITPANIKHRANRDKGTEANIHAQAPVKNRGAKSTALA